MVTAAAVIVQLALDGIFSRTFLLGDILCVSSRGSSSTAEDYRSTISVVTTDATRDGGPTVAIKGVFYADAVGAFYMFTPSDVPFTFGVLDSRKSMV